MSVRAISALGRVSALYPLFWIWKPEDNPGFYILSHYAVPLHGEGVRMNDDA
jgi:hypothetical protein